MEPLEAFRHIALLSPNGKYIINTAPVPTILSNIKIDMYPSQEQLLADIQQRNLTGYFINATQEAKNIGDALLVNVVMLGAFSKVSNIVADTVVLAKLLSLVDERYHQAGKLAFECGRRIIQLEG